jgi:FixJ family two-component response regulator
VTDKRDITILVVDDDESVRRALKRLMQSAGFKVETFGSAREFLNTGATNRPGIMVVDVRLPEMTGLELQKHLAASGVEIPVIFISAHEDSQAVEMALAAGAVTFLYKPFDDHDLLAAIDRALDQTASERAD